MRIPVDVIDQGFYFLGLIAGVPTTGLTTFSVEYSKNGGTSWSDMTTPTITEIDNGAYFLLCDEGMTLSAGNVSEAMLFRITQATMDTAWKEIEIYRPIEGIIRGAATGTPTSTSMNTDLTGFADGDLPPRSVIFISGTANGQLAEILTYTSASGVITYAALNTTAVAGDKFVVV